MRLRPVTLLATVVLLLGLLQWLRAVTLFLRRDTLTQLNLSLSLPYAIGVAAIWGTVLSGVALGVGRLTRVRLILIGLAVTAWQAHTWLDRWLFAQSGYAQTTLGFDLGVTVTLLVLTWSVVWQQQKQIKRIGE